MRHTRDNPFGILILAIPFVVGGIILLSRNTPGVVAAGQAYRVSDAPNFVVETASVNMEHAAGVFGIVVGVIITWFYFKLRNG
jgi:hypothetical protein